MSLAADVKPTDILTLQVGTVTDNADPEGLYRVKFTIPNLIEPESDWTFPLGTNGGGGPQRGGFIVPEVGHIVGILFHNGDREAPYYMCGWWGTPDEGTEMPDPARQAGADAHRVASLQLGNFTFAVDEREGKLIFSVVAKDQKTGDPAIEVHLDFVRKRLTLRAIAAIILQTPGLIHLDALAIHLSDRPVAVTSKPV